MNLAAFSELLKVLLQIANVAVLGYALYKFLNKPHTDLETRVTTLEIELKDTRQSLLQGNDKFRDLEDRFQEQKKTNSTFKSVMLSFVNFEIAYCIHTGYEHQEELMKAKAELENYLSGK